MIWILAGVCSITISANILLITLWLINFKSYPSRNQDLPKVSVLIAARNEEQNIKRCLESIAELNYPNDKLEILIGDDDSQDDTLKIIHSFENNPIVKSVSIEQQYHGLRGKANVLAQLAQAANGDYYFMTDADIAVPKNWIRQLLGAMAENVGMVIGVSGIKNNQFQHIEWLFSLGMMKVITDLHQPVTGIGNNMVISKEAYHAVGGYKNIPFSITEDYELFKQIRKKGYQCHHVYQPDALVVSEPVLGFSKLMKQRKRWMHGAVQLPWLMVVLLFIQGAFSMAIIPLLFIDFQMAFGLLALKWFTQFGFMLLASNKVKRKVSPIHHILYELYSTVVSITSMVYFIIPGKVKWKGRRY